MNDILTIPHLIKSNQPISRLDFSVGNLKLTIVVSKNFNDSYNVFVKKTKKNELVIKKTNILENHVNKVIYDLKERMERKFGKKQ